MSTKQRTILIVEDEATILYALQSKLSVDGFDILAVSDGAKALEALDSVIPDLILLDLILPLVDGWHVLEKIKEDNELKNVPVMIMTNLTDTDSKDRGVKLGASDFIIKAEYNLDDIVIRIHRLLDTNHRKTE